MVLTPPRLDAGENKCYTHRKKEVVHLKKRLTALLVFCLEAGCVLSFLAWKRAAGQAAEWRARAEEAERRAAQAETALETAGDDPIAAFFDCLPYSGATAGYLSSLEADAYRAELENAARLLRNGDSGIPVDAFLSFLDAQAQAEADVWTASLEAWGASTAGAWSHVSQCRVPVYRFGTYALISTCQRAGKSYSFLFNPEEIRQALLDAGIPETDLPAAERIKE